MDVPRWRREKRIRRPPLLLHLGWQRDTGTDSEHAVHRKQRGQSRMSWGGTQW